MSDEPDRETTFLYGFARRGETGALVEHLADADQPVIRRRAAELLGDFDDLPRPARQEEVTAGLIEAVVEDDDDSVRARAIDALSRHGEESLERLVGRLVDEDGAENPDWVTTETLLAWLDSEYPEFRMVAAATLGELGDETALPALVETLEDSDPRVRERAARSCGRLGDDRCVPYLRERLTDEHVPVQRAAVTALASVGTDRAREALCPVATEAAVEDIRRLAADELGAFESPDAFETLLAALGDDSAPVARAALLSILDLLAAAPADRVPALREQVAERLRERESVTLEPLMTVYHESTQPDRREHAVWLLSRALGEYHDAGVECLLDALESDTEAIAAAAETGLERLDDPAVANRLRILVERGEAPEETLDRAAALLEDVAETPGEVVTNSVDITYIRKPADYGDGDGGDS